MPTFAISETSDEQTARVNAKGGRSLVRSFEVESSDPANTDGRSIIEAIGTQLGIYIGVGHPSWVWAVCSDIDPGRPDRDDPRLWRAKVLYEEPTALPGTTSGGSPPGPPPPPSPPPPPGTPPAPADRPAFVSVSFRKEEVFEVEDLDGKKLQNSAGDPLENVPPRFAPRGQINYTRWFSPGGWSYATGLLLIGKVNLFAWNTFGVYTLLIDGIDATPKTERGFTFWEVKFVFLHKPSGWIPTEILDVGRAVYRRGQPRTKENKQPILGSSSPRLLNGIGEEWLEGAPPAGDGDPTLLPFRFYDSISFAGL